MSRRTNLARNRKAAKRQRSRERRRREILEYIDEHERFPVWASHDERKALIMQGFIFADEGLRGTHCLTSLGELEAGYPETTHP